MATNRAAQQAEKDRREEVCAAIVCDVLGNGARWRRRDVLGGPPALHDFDIEFADGHREALEVSAYTDAPAEAQRAALEGNDRRDSHVLRGVWLLAIPDRGLDLGELYSGKLHSRIEAELVVLERHGLDRFVDGEHWHLVFQLGGGHPLVQASRALIGIGIRDGYSLPPQPGMTPFFELRTSTGGAVDPGSVNRAVEDRAASNAAKLNAAPGVTARHIFVPIYFGAPMTFIAALHVEGSRPPSLPSAVTRAWVLGAPEHVLYAAPPDDWRSASFDARATSEPHLWRA